MILGSHQKCNHLLLICERCLSTGCNVHYCSNSIGNGNSSICKVCGAREVVTIHARRNVPRASKTVNNDYDKRLKALETNTRTHDTSYSQGSKSMAFGTFKGWIIFLAICWIIRETVDYKDYEGGLSFVIGLFHIGGAIADMPIQIIKHYLN